MEGMKSLRDAKYVDTQRKMIDRANACHSGDLVAEQFINLPHRDTEGYYQLIRKPMALNKMAKAVQGVMGRETPSGVSIFMSWSAMEDMMSLIWKNARIFNEDGSEISNQAGMLEVRTLFHTLLLLDVLTKTGLLQAPCR